MEEQQYQRGRICYTPRGFGVVAGVCHDGNGKPIINVTFEHRSLNFPMRKVKLLPRALENPEKYHSTWLASGRILTEKAAEKSASN